VTIFENFHLGSMSSKVIASGEVIVLSNEVLHMFLTVVKLIDPGGCFLGDARQCSFSRALYLKSFLVLALVCEKKKKIIRKRSKKQKQEERRQTYQQAHLLLAAGFIRNQIFQYAANHFILGVKSADKTFMECHATKWTLLNQMTSESEAKQKHESSMQIIFTISQICRPKCFTILIRILIMNLIHMSKFVTSHLKKNTIQLSPILVTSLTLPSHQAEYKSPWTVFKNTIPPGFENASTIS
jgi:hypothetical protein